MKLGVHIGYWGMGLTSADQLEIVQEAERLGPAIGAQLLAHAGGQATTGSANGIATAEQLLAATRAALAEPAPSLPSGAGRPRSAPRV